MVGFFVVPVVGLPLFFVVAVYLCELARVGATNAWPSSLAAIRAAALSYGIEIATGLALAVAWGGAVFVFFRG